jgi:uncharacterized protein YndB with AHSA1/START domain
MIDLRPGGTFHTVLQGPDGTTVDNPGCYLEVVPNRRLVCTTALGPGYRPQDHDIPFTAIITLEPKGKGTRYHVLARRKDEATAKQHVEMGFHAGWSRGAGPARRGGEHGVAGAPKPDVTRAWSSYSSEPSAT